MENKWKLTRDVTLFIAGLLGIIHETFASGPQQRIELLIVFASMMGLPAFLRKDEAK